jgi:hypothetical protein
MALPVPLDMATVFHSDVALDSIVGNNVSRDTNIRRALKLLPGLVLESDRLVPLILVIEILEVVKVKYIPEVADALIFETVTGDKVVDAAGLTDITAPLGVDFNILVKYKLEFVAVESAVMHTFPSFESPIVVELLLTNAVVVK